MSLGQRAVILIRLDARMGEVVPVADLASHMGLPVALVRERILELWNQGYLQPQWDVGTDGSTVLTGAMATQGLMV